MQMKQSKKMNHIPIFDAETGLKAGYLAGLQYGDLTRTEGLFFIDLQGRWRQVETNQVELFGEDAIFLKPGFKARILDKQPKKVRDEQRKLIPVLTPDGTCPGRISDIILQDEKIVGVEISDGIIKDILQGRGFLLYRDIAKWGKDMVLVNPDAILYRPQLSLAARLGRAGYIIILILLTLPLTPLIRPLLFSLLIAYSLYPFNLYLRKKGLSNSVAALSAIFLLLISLAVLILILIPPMQRELNMMLQTLPKFFDQYNQLLQTIPEHTQKWGISTGNGHWQQVLKRWQDLILLKIEGVLAKITANLGRLLDLFLAPVLAYYILKEWEKIRDGILSLFSVKVQGDLTYTGSEIHKVIQSFLKGNLLTSVIVGILTYFGLLLIQLDFPGFMAVLAALGNLIPYFGAIFSTIPVIFLGWLQSPVKALLAAFLVVIIQQIESNIITPKILSHSLGLSPLMIILSLIIGGEYFGVLGMFLAAPAAAIVQILGKRIIAKLF